MGLRETAFFRVVFVAAAVWNLAGGTIGYFHTAHSFQLLYDRELADPLFAAIYRGACGTTLLYFVGYSIVAYNPLKHTGIVLVGGLGKIAFALHLLTSYRSGIATSHALVVIIGDFAFFAAFVYFLGRSVRCGNGVL